MILIKVLRHSLPEVLLHLQLLRILLPDFHVKSRIVNEYIVSCFVGNESVTFLVVKPFYCTFVHVDTSIKINNKVVYYLRNIELD